MSKTNCSNCGGPLNIADPKCPFCGTKNINLTDIDLASGEAANFIFRMPHNIKVNDQEIYLSMLAIPELLTMEMTSTPTNFYGGLGNVPMITYDSRELNFTLNLRAIPHSDSNKICNLTFK